jgi:hypothetical protein
MLERLGVSSAGSILREGDLLSVGLDMSVRATVLGQSIIGHLIHDAISHRILSV